VHGPLEAHERQVGPSLVPALLALERPAGLEAELHVPQGGAPRQQLGVLEDHRPVGTGAVDHAAVDLHGAGGDLLQAHEDPQQGGLAAPALAGQGHQLAGTDGERDVVEGLDDLGRALLLTGELLGHADHPDLVDPGSGGVRSGLRGAAHGLMPFTPRPAARRYAFDAAAIILYDNVAGKAPTAPCGGAQALFFPAS
jgi:hypothetical protein